MIRIVTIKFCIPEDKKELYTKLLLLYSKYGEEAIKDCNSVNSASSKNIITCWNMFMAASAAFQLEEYKKANLLYDYVEGQIKLLYNDSDLYDETATVIKLEDWDEYEYT